MAKMTSENPNDGVKDNKGLTKTLAWIIGIFVLIFLLLGTAIYFSVNSKKSTVVDTTQNPGANQGKGGINPQGKVNEPVVIQPVETQRLFLLVKKGQYRTLPIPSGMMVQTALMDGKPGNGFTHWVNDKPVCHIKIEKVAEQFAPFEGLMEHKAGFSIDDDSPVDEFYIGVYVHDKSKGPLPGNWYTELLRLGVKI